MVDKSAYPGNYRVQFSCWTTAQMDSLRADLSKLEGFPEITDDMIEDWTEDDSSEASIYLFVDISGYVRNFLIDEMIQICRDNYIAGQDWDEESYCVWLTLSNLDDPTQPNIYSEEITPC